MYYPVPKISVKLINMKRKKEQEEIDIHATSRVRRSVASLSVTNRLSMTSQPMHHLQCQKNISCQSLQCATSRLSITSQLQLPCDEDFGLDEKRKHKMEAVYSLSQWMSIARRARKKPFEVTEMAAESFLKIKDLCRDVVNRKKNESDEKVDWLRIRWMRFRKDRANQMLYKYSVDDNEFMVVNFSKKGRGRPQHTLINKLQCLYPEGRVISAARYKDITDLLKYVRPVFHDFYRELPHQRRQNSGPECADDVFEHDSEGITDTEL